jgi:hypothetical protein
VSAVSIVKIDSIEFFETLADTMNADPARFTVLGEAYMDCVLVMRDRPSLAYIPQPDFAVRLVFDGVRCEHVVATEPDEPADFKLVGPVEAWNVMFDDIAVHGRAEGLQTINSLALLGGAIACVGSDPMGIDKFSRFNQTLQEFFDGAARVAVPA